MKAKTVFFCTACGGESVRWMGKCPHCGEWNTLVEEKIQTDKAPKQGGRVNLPLSKAQPIEKVSSEVLNRWETLIPEFDTVLGGGLTPGSSVLLGGEPGIGKSTLLLQTAKNMTRYGRVLYLSGEESAQQIKGRAERLNAVAEDLWLLAQTDLTAALEEAQEIQPNLLIVDSVQAVFCPELEAAPGSVSQVRAVAAAAIAFARASGATVLLIGHVTKEGQLAGPRVLEHMVDTVLHFEGERYNAFRLLRAVKNRFGSTNEVGVFEMGAKGLTGLTSPSAYFLGERHINAPGSAVCCVLQGTRPLLLEVQALISKSSFANPRRQATGFDYNRLVMLSAVLERKLGLALQDKDIFLNVAGGMRLDDPGADLAVAAACVSSLLDKEVEKGVLLLGEVGLLGELRHVSQLERRLKEGASFGFSAAITPPGEKTEKSPIRRLMAKDLPTALTLLGLV